MRSQVGSDPGPSYNLARSWTHYGSNAGGPTVARSSSGATTSARSLATRTGSGLLRSAMTVIRSGRGLDHWPVSSQLSGMHMEHSQ